MAKIREIDVGETPTRYARGWHCLGLVKTFTDGKPHAIRAFGTKLVVVLGHSHCGAVEAAVNQLEHPEEGHSPNLAAIVDRILPAIESVVDAADAADHGARLSAAVRANIQTSTEQLRHSSKILSDLAEHEGLTIVGAEYCLESGIVNFFDAQLG